MNQELITGTTTEGNSDCGQREYAIRAAGGRGILLYGLPCARCKAYYAAELPACPVCKSTERVSAKQKQIVACVPPRLSKQAVVANYCATECSFPPVAGSVGVLLGKGDGTFRAAKTYPSGGDGTVSVAVADVNKDGKPDILVANCGPLACGPGSPGGNVAVLIGKGNGTFKPAFRYSAANSPFNVVAADVNGDGNLDIVVSNWGTSNGGTNDGSVTVLVGKGNGTFRPAQVFPSGGAEAPSVAVADVNKDGRPDIVLACVADTLNQTSTGVVTVLINATKTAPR